MKIDIEKFKADAHFNILHWEFGSLLVRRGKIAEGDPDRDAMILLAAKCLQAVEQGHSCLDLRKWRDLPTDLEDAPLPSPLAPEEWSAIAEKHPDIVGDADGAGPGNCLPLLFDRKHLLVYLNKYHRAEKEIADRLHHYVGLGMLDRQVDENDVREINTLFQKKPASGIDDDPQQAAVLMALTHPFSILTGGPGTGKTTVLATILALELNSDPQLRIGLAAPTGKAAMQMLDSLNEELSLHLVDAKLKPGVRDRLRALTSSTIHRMLGIGRGNAKPRFDEDNPLPYDLIVIDECSMIPLHLMHRLCKAIPKSCRLLLVGDQNQLAAVEAGCLLGDFCSRSKLLEPRAGVRPYKNYITRLVENHRSDANPDLKNFILKINTTTGVNGDISAKMRDEIDRLYSGVNPDFRACEVILEGNKKERIEALTTRLEKEVGAMLSAAVLPKRFGEFFGAEKTRGVVCSLENWKKLRCGGDENDVFGLALAHFYVESFRIMCGIHDGPFGEINLNRMMGKITGKKTGDDGFPIIVLKNDPALHLYNGDIGICWGGKVYFPKWVLNGTDLGFDCSKSCNILQLPPYDAAYAMTIHKSQGSGFDNVIMSLPEKANSVLCRELIYTGISRTKRKFLLWSPKELFCQTIDRECERWSGMPFRLEDAP